MIYIIIQNKDLSNIHNYNTMSRCPNTIMFLQQFRAVFFVQISLFCWQCFLYCFEKVIWCLCLTYSKTLFVLVVLPGHGTGDLKSS